MKNLVHDWQNQIKLIRSVCLPLHVLDPKSFEQLTENLSGT